MAPRAVIMTHRSAPAPDGTGVGNPWKSKARALRIFAHRAHDPDWQLRPDPGPGRRTANGGRGVPFCQDWKTIRRSARLHGDSRSRFSIGCS